MTQFEILFDAIDLWEAGRKNAARAQWKALTEEFKDLVLQYLLFGLDHRQEISTTTPVTLRSPKFGIFNCCPETLGQIVHTVPELIS